MRGVETASGRRAQRASELNADRGADGLASKGESIDKLRELDLRFVPGAKPGDRESLFERVNGTPFAERRKSTDKSGKRHEFRYLNGVPPNKMRFDLEANFLECREKRPNGKERCLSRIANLPIDDG